MQDARRALPEFLYLLAHEAMAIGDIEALIDLMPMPAAPNAALMKWARETAQRIRVDLDAQTYSPQAWLPMQIAKIDEIAAH